MERLTILERPLQPKPALLAAAHLGDGVTEQDDMVIWLVYALGIHGGNTGNVREDIEHIGVGISVSPAPADITDSLIQTRREMAISTLFDYLRCSMSSAF